MRGHDMIESGLESAMPDGLRAWALASNPAGRYQAIYVADPLTRRVLARKAANAAAQDTLDAPVQAVMAVGKEKLYVFAFGDVQRAAETGPARPALELPLGDVAVDVASGRLWRRTRLRAPGLTCTLFLNMLGAGRKRPRALLAALAGAGI